MHLVIWMRSPCCVQCYSAVVGPIGGGKSNAIDAMLFAFYWVCLCKQIFLPHRNMGIGLRLRLLSTYALHNLDIVICMCWCSVSQLWLGQMVVGRAMSLMLCFSSLASVPNRSFFSHLFKKIHL